MTRTEAEERLLLSRVALEQLTWMIDDGHIPVESIVMVTAEIESLENLVLYFPERPQKVETVAQAYIALRALIMSVAN